MGKRNKKSGGKFGWLFILVLVVVVAAGAVAYYASSGLRHKIVQLQTKPVVTVTPTPSPVHIIDKRKVTIYLPKVTGDGSSYLVPVTRTTSAKGDILDVALETLIDTGKRESVYTGLIPKSTRLLSPIKVKSGIATVNLSKEFVDNFSGGSDQEALTLNSIVHTLVTNSGGKVSSVKILVEGESVETLGGHFELTDPIVADSTLLRPNNSK